MTKALFTTFLTSRIPKMRFSKVKHLFVCMYIQTSSVPVPLFCKLWLWGHLQLDCLRPVNRLSLGGKKNFRKKHFMLLTKDEFSVSILQIVFYQIDAAGSLLASRLIEPEEAMLRLPGLQTWHSFLFFVCWWFYNRTHCKKCKNCLRQVTGKSSLNVCQVCPVSQSFPSVPSVLCFPSFPSVPSVPSVPFVQSFRPILAVPSVLFFPSALFVLSVMFFLFFLCWSCLS